MELCKGTSAQTTKGMQKFDNNANMWWISPIYYNSHASGQLSVQLFCNPYFSKTKFEQEKGMDLLTMKMPFCPTHLLKPERRSKSTNNFQELQTGKMKMK